MARYSNLKPMTIFEKIHICFKMFRLFGTDELLKKEARDFLKIAKKPGIETPFSLQDFMNFFSHKDSYDYSTRRKQVLEIARKLESKGFLSHAGTKGFMLGTEKCYYIAFELTKIQKNGYLYLGSVFGPELIYEAVKHNIVHITGITEKGDVVGGTGILISNNIVLTCEHVVTDMYKMDDTLTIQNKEYKIIRYESHTTVDVAYIEIENTSDIFIKDLAFENGNVLEKIITLGYPPVPRSTHPVLVVQTGEVTGYMNDCYKNDYMLFSAIARPGNSGGPIISENGRVVGIVSKEVKYDGTATFPFFAAVPASAIANALKEIKCPIELPIDDYE